MTEAWRPKHNPYVIALAVTLATFMEILDSTIVNVSLPHIAGSLSASIDEATWVLTSYLVSNAIVLPLGGWLSMIFGRKNFYQTCVALFTISSCLCGLAPSLSFLVFFRILQGLGGGGLQPSEQAILADTFPREKQGMGMAVYGIAVVCAPIIGPTLGGWITDHYSWRWIFFINIPIGIISIMLTTWLVEDPPFLLRKSMREVKIDYAGFGLLALGLGFLQFVLDRGDRDDWFASHFIAIASIVALVALTAATYWELKAKDPVVDLRLFKDRNFALANLVMFMLGFVLFGSTVLIPVFLQQLMGYSAMMSGLVLSPGGFATMLLMPLVGYLTSKVEARWLVLFGIVVAASSLFRLSHISLNVDFHTMMWIRVAQASGLAFLFVPINAIAYYFLPKEKSSYGSSLINLARNLGASFGISFGTHILNKRPQFHQSILTSRITPGNHHYQALLRNLTAFLMRHASSMVNAHAKAVGLLSAQLMRQATMLSFIDAFRLLGMLFLTMVPVVFLMKKTSPRQGGAAMH